MMTKVRQMLRTYKATGWYKKTYNFSRWVALVVAALPFVFRKAFGPLGPGDIIILVIVSGVLTLLVWAYVQAFSYLVWRTAQQSRGFKRIAILLYPSSLIMCITYFWPDSHWRFFDRFLEQTLFQVALSILLGMLVFNVFIWVLEGFQPPRKSDY
ncbi:MAG: hypothetical protein AAFN16_09090 [Pseudomonadota bacterium]